MGLGFGDQIGDLLHIEALDESYWGKMLVIPYKYIRSVLFRLWLFYSPEEAWGDSLETSRKVKTIFLAMHLANRLGTKVFDGDQVLNLRALSFKLRTWVIAINRCEA